MAQSEKTAPPPYKTPSKLMSGSDVDTIYGLREQIKSNATHLFLYGAPMANVLNYDVIVMTVDNAAEGEGDSFEGSSVTAYPKYQAVVTYLNSGSLTMQKKVGAKGPPSDTVIAALQSMLHVLACALERYQGNVLKNGLAAPVQIAGGMIDEQAVLGKSWKPWKST